MKKMWLHAIQLTKHWAVIYDNIIQGWINALDEKKQGLILSLLGRSHKTVSVCSEIQQLYSRENGYKKKSLQ